MCVCASHTHTHTHVCIACALHQRSAHEIGWDWLSLSLSINPYIFLYGTGKSASADGNVFCKRTRPLLLCPRTRGLSSSLTRTHNRAWEATCNENLSASKLLLALLLLLRWERARARVYILVCVCMCMCICLCVCVCTLFLEPLQRNVPLSYLLMQVKNMYDVCVCAYVYIQGIQGKTPIYMYRAYRAKNLSKPQPRCLRSWVKCRGVFIWGVLGVFIEGGVFILGRRSFRWQTTNECRWVGYNTGVEA